MSLHYLPGIGTVHLQTVKPARVVPAHERHRWDAKPGWGETATCTKCGCMKIRKKPEYQEYYRQPGTLELLTERPNCR